jgi:hypothetical protein
VRPDLDTDPVRCAFEVRRGKHVVVDDAHLVGSAGRDQEGRKRTMDEGLGAHQNTWIPSTKEVVVRSTLDSATIASTAANALVRAESDWA